MTAEPHSRRSVLTAGAAVAGAAVGAVALSSCGTSGNAATAGTKNAQPAPAPGQPLVALADVPVGEAKAAKGPDGSDIVVARTAENTAAAFSAICTHQGCTVAPQGAELKCPCHGSVFDALTGAVKNGPAKQPLPPVKVRVDNGQIVTG
ncbi:Rieske (2Fe-2S) protein [Amycolatopsis sp. NPDC059027]|uniref:Rieske (2Fe-2S) protein n=1 Tax=unclassified Amycolatopsis TaxID=2618356 RepID=UPI00366E85A3